ncbi:putative carboxylesterase [Helianthus anomalus]
MRESEYRMGEKELKKPHFVFIHGAGGGSWCWYKIKCLMYNSGYTVTCLDLKGAGIDLSDPNKILSFDEYNKPLIDFLSSLPDHEQVVLVGHSAGGLSVTDASHKFPKKIALAVYVAATMLKHGLSTEQDFIDGAPDVSEFGDTYDLEIGLGPDQPPTSAIVKKEEERKLFYNMSPIEDVTLASMLLRPTLVYAFQRAEFKEGTEVVEKVPRVYIKTTYDKIVKPERQDRMIAKWPPSNVYVIVVQISLIHLYYLTN